MARTGGAFPFPLAQVAEGGGVIALASGGVWYPPAGQYLVQTGALTAIEWWDPIGQFWRDLTAGVMNSDYITTDGYNYRFINTSGTVSLTTITGAGSGGTNGIGFAATGANVAIAVSNTTGGANATAYAIVGGSVAAPTIAAAGSGFLVPPLVVIDPPPVGGIQATATCALTAGGGIASVTMANVGAGYASSPNFWLIPQTAIYQGGPSGGVAAGPIPPPGLVFPGNAVPGNQNTSAAGAQLVSVALTGSGTLTGIRIINAGGGYTSASPAVTVTGVGAATATATVSNTTPAVDQSFAQPRVWA